MRDDRERGGVRIGVHRVSLRAAGREPEQDEEVHHKCPNTLCVNPDHLVALRRKAHFAFHRKWTDEMLLDGLRDCARFYGREPTAMDLNRAMAKARGHGERAMTADFEGWPSATVVQERFGSWRAALCAAGFSDRSSGKRPKVFSS
jgi:hypothetical protein